MSRTYARSDFRPALEWIEALPPEQLAEVRAGAARLIEQSYLAEIRKALKTTQSELAARSGMAQADVSRIENNPQAVQLRTLQRYVDALGGELRLVADFPGGVSAQIPLKAGKPVKSRIRIGTPQAAE